MPGKTFKDNEGNELIQYDNGDIEMSCYKCNEPMLIVLGDVCHVCVTENNKAFPICQACFKEGEIL